MLACRIHSVSPSYVLIFNLLSLDRFAGIADTLPTVLLTQISYIPLFFSL